MLQFLTNFVWSAQALLHPFQSAEALFLPVYLSSRNPEPQLSPDPNAQTGSQFGCKPLRGWDFSNGARTTNRSR